MKYDCVIFDLDGTLLNTLNDLQASLNWTLDKFGYAPLDINDVRLFVGSGGRNLIKRAIGKSVSDKALETVFKAYQARYDECLNVMTEPYPGICELLSRLKNAGVKIGVDSNKHDEAVRYLMNAHFSGLYDECVGESESVPKKPSPVGVELLLSRLNAQNAVYVGDSGVDVQTAANSGLPLLWVSWGFRTLEELAPFTPEIAFHNAEALGDYLLL